LSGNVTRSFQLQDKAPLLIICTFFIKNFIFRSNI